MTTWRMTSASRKGSSHSDGIPNQDAVRCTSLPDGHGGSVWVVAVSDGHGGARYVRSDVGSRFAVDTAIDILSEVLAAPSSLPPADLLRAEVGSLVERWRAEVSAHHLAHAFTDEEVRRAGVPTLDVEPFVAYGATLLVAIVGDSGVGIAQIGDGDALIRTHGFATRPVPGDSRLVGGQTTSLCLDTAADDFRFAGLPATADPDLVLLATDGYGNSFADNDWWQGLVGDFAWFLDTEGFEELDKQLPTWLGDSAHVGGDDVTAAVVVRDPLVVPPVRSEAPVVVVEPPIGRTLPMPEEEDAPLPAPERSSRAALFAVAAVVAVLAVVAAVIFLLGGDDGDPPLTPGETTTSPTGSVSESTTPRRPRGSRTPGGKNTPVETVTTLTPTSTSTVPRSGGTGAAP
ncbi:MAG TPA: PP2C family serine/threonine-protein phosphatase [Nocardioidaceae bacterium]|nr:PP2C family serine/threonine-protein phosphatase [Nocardioidaceae bacterium]